MDAASEDMSFKRSTFRIIIRNVKVMQFSFVRTEWGLLSSDRFRNEKINLIELEEKGLHGARLSNANCQHLLVSLDRFG